MMSKNVILETLVVSFAIISVIHGKNVNADADKNRLYSEIITMNELSDSCELYLRKNVNNVSSTETLERNMIDARSTEMYDRCLGIDNLSEALNRQYCMLGYRQNNKSEEKNNTTPDDIYWGVCLPESCNVTKELGKVQIDEDIAYDLNVWICTTNKTPDLSTSQIVATSFLSILGLLLFIGTTVDLVFCLVKNFKPRPKDENWKIILVLNSFSIYSNAKKILDVETKEDTLSAVHGIRFFSMAWVILGQTYFSLNGDFVRNFNDVSNYAEDFAFQVVLRSNIATDVFYFVSGLTVVYITMKRIKKNNEINWPFLYIHRIVRLLPAFGLVILSTFLMPLLGSGPFWTLKWRVLTNRCEQNWWPAILFVNNFVRTDEICVEQSWFLANLMQFFIITPVILIFLWKLPIVGIILNCLLLATSFITPALLLSEDIIPAVTSITGFSLENDFMNTIFLKPYSRIGPYVVGIALGHTLVYCKKINILKVVQLCFWCVAITFGLAVVYGPYQWSNGILASKEINAFYAAASGTAFAFAVAWLTYACVNGYGGFINKILSWKVFIPLSRMTYMAFLMHHFVIYSFTWSLRESITFSHYYIVLLYFAFMVMIFGVSFLASISFEMPFIELEKVLSQNVLKSKKKEIEEEMEINRQFDDVQAIVDEQQEVPSVSGSVNEGYVGENDK